MHLDNKFFLVRLPTTRDVCRYFTFIIYVRIEILRSICFTKIKVCADDDDDEGDEHDCLNSTRWKKNL